MLISIWILDSNYPLKVQIWVSDIEGDSSITPTEDFLELYTQFQEMVDEVCKIMLNKRDEENRNAKMLAEFPLLENFLKIKTAALAG
jgi:hypothetical protein